MVLPSSNCRNVCAEAPAVACDGDGGSARGTAVCAAAAGATGGGGEAIAKVAGAGAAQAFRVGGPTPTQAGLFFFGPSNTIRFNSLRLTLFRSFGAWWRVPSCVNGTMERVVGFHSGEKVLWHAVRWSLIHAHTFVGM